MLFGQNIWSTESKPPESMVSYKSCGMGSEECCLTVTLDVLRITNVGYLKFKTAVTLGEMKTPHNEG